MSSRLEQATNFCLSQFGSQHSTIRAAIELQRPCDSQASSLPAWLGVHGVRLVGMDFPSVDGPDSKELPTHHALEAARVLILENLDLRAAEPGVYELIALPLKVRGGDGSPVRAVLRRA